MRQHIVRDQLENIVQTKVNSINFEHGHTPSPQTEEVVTIPKPAPRKVSPKNHHAPSIPSTPASNVATNMVTEAKVTNKYGQIENNRISKNKKTSAPPPPRVEKRSPENKGKLNIQISNFESSKTNYSTLERRNL